MSATKIDRISPNALAQNPRATFASWLKYESIILSAYHTFPKPYTFKPTNMKPSSVCSKARDAVRGKIAFDYPNGTETDVSTADITRWYAQVVFRYDIENVHIAQPEVMKQILMGLPVHSEAPAFSFTTLTFEEIVAFTVLLASNRVRGPVVISFPPDLTLLRELPNVQILPQSDGSVVLL